jgi:predicted hydrocarbon binding protein
LTTGFIDEALQWVTGKEIKVIETDCIAVGDAYCRFEVGKEIPQKNST